MLPDLVSNPEPLTYESGALPIALRGPALFSEAKSKQSYYHQYSQMCSGSCDISRHAICVKCNLC